MGLSQVTFDPAVGALGQFMLGDGRKEARGGPALPVGRFGEPGPKGLDGGQAQLVQHDAETGFVDGMRALHATSPTQVLATSAS